MAERVAGANAQALQQFVTQSPWAHAALQPGLARGRLRRRAGRRAVLVLDGTTLPKQGKSSVGVARQYCGALGTVANCQAIVTWHSADEQSHCPLLGRLYLPQVWTADAARMQQAGLPAAERLFEEKWKIALKLLDEIAPEKQPKTVEVVALRVRETNTQAWRRPGAERWLLIERLGDGAVKYYVSNAGRHISVRQMILWAHERWKIEQGYQQLKEELGLDHFEGRSWRGLHHHLTLCFIAYCFLQTVRRGKKKPLDVTAGEALAQSGVELDAVSGMSQLSSRATGRAVRLNLNYLT
jgi:SRSO17 transposase